VVRLCQAELRSRRFLDFSAQISYNEYMASDKLKEAESADVRTRRSEEMGGLAKGLAIIEAFSSRQAQLTITDAARATGTTPAAARRCLLTLESLGYVSHDGHFFRPTPRMARLGATYNATSLPMLAQACLASVRDQLDESCSLAVLDGANVAFIARAESQRIVSAAVRLGAQLPAYSSASGRVLLAEFSEAELDAYLGECRPTATTRHALTQISDIRRRIKMAREEGVAFTDEELELGMRTMAVPVRDPGGMVQAAMSVSTFAARTSLTEMREVFQPVLQREAGRLGRML
jgi:IclR family pca regulon transcriptional regulator